MRYLKLSVASLKPYATSYSLLRSAKGGYINSNVVGRFERLQNALNNTLIPRENLIDGCEVLKYSDLFSTIDLEVDYLATDKTWQEICKCLRVYNNHYGYELKRGFKTLNGFVSCADGYDLFTFSLIHQIIYANYCGKTKLTDNERFSKLSRLCIFKEIKSELENWNKMYKLLCNYYAAHNSLNVDINFKTNNGKDFNKNGLPLGVWVKKQKVSYELAFFLFHYSCNDVAFMDQSIFFLAEITPIALTESKRLLLEEVGFEFEDIVQMRKKIQLCRKYGIKYPDIWCVPYDILNSNIKSMKKCGLPILVNGRPNSRIFLSSNESIGKQLSLKL